MDPREQFDDLGEVIRTAVDNALANVWTALPCKVVRDSNGFTVNAQSTIQLKQFDRQTGKSVDLDMPVMPNLPVHYAGGSSGGFTITHPIKENDEGIILFASRCIDGWWENGSERPQPQLWQRRHSPSDGIYIPGIRSKPTRLGGDEGNGRMRDGSQASSKPPSGDSLQIRTEAGDVYIEVTSDSVNIITTKKVTISAPDGVRIDSPKVEITGDLEVKGEVSAKANGSSVKLSTHRHSDVQGGLGQSGQPVPGS